MENLEYIELSDGSENIKLRLLDSFGVDERDFAALLDEEKDEVYILEVEFEGEDAIFKSIEDEDEFNEILAIYNDLLDEEDIDE